MALRRFRRSWSSPRAPAMLSAKSKSLVVMPMDSLPQEFGQMLAGNRHAGMRHGAGDVHQAAAIAGHQPPTRRFERYHVTLSVTMAAEMAGCLTAKVPPNPQHSVSRSNSTKRHVFQLPDQCLGMLDDVHFAQGVAGAVPGDRHRDRRGPQASTASTLSRYSDSSNTRSENRRAASSSAVPANSAG
jgi:hypothetical protein